MNAHREFELPDAEATLRIGASLAPSLAGGLVVTLQGDLGAGKTTLVRGMLRALGWQGPVKSPTYTLVEHYPLSSIYFYHFDFYRLVNSDEWKAAGLDECFRSDAVCVIEWPERAAGLPPPDLALQLSHRPTGRRLRAQSSSAAGDACVAVMTAG